MRICGRNAQHRAHAADHAVDQQAAQRPFGHVRRDPAAGGRRGRLDRLHRRPRPDEHRLEHDQHHHGEDQRAPQAVRQHAVDPIGGGRLVAARLDHHAFEHAAGPVVAGGGFDRRHRAAGRRQPGPRRFDPTAPTPVGVVQQASAASSRSRPTAAAAPGSAAAADCRILPPIPPPAARLPPRTPRAADSALWCGRPVCDVGLQARRLLHNVSASPLTALRISSGLQPRQADPPIGLDRHDRNAQLPFEPRQIDANPAVLGHVEHVDGQHGGQPQFEHLADQIQIAMKVAGVDDAHHGVDRRQRPSAGPTADRPPPFRRASGAPGCTGPAGRSTRTAGRRTASGRSSSRPSRPDSCPRAGGRRPGR